MSFSYEAYRKRAEDFGHSEEFINSTISYARNLDDKGLPVIFSLQDFASKIGMPSDIIKEIIRYRSNQYTRFKIQKKTNTNEFRYLMCPDSKLRYIQRWINRNILQKVKVSDACVAFVPGKSVFLNAYIHRNADMLLKVDLLKFFDTITEARVFGIFKMLGYHSNLAVDFAKLTTTFHYKSFWNTIADTEILSELIKLKPAILPQGAPSSPQLSNLVASTIDNRIIKLCEGLKCRYSRYADDLAFSTSNGIGKLPHISIIRKIVEEEGFFINQNKVKVFKRGVKQYVTGFTVTHGAKIPKKERQEIIKHLYYSIKYGPYNHLQRWLKDNGFKDSFMYSYHDWLLGKISFIMSANFQVGKKMLNQFNKIDWNLDPP